MDLSPEATENRCSTHGTSRIWKESFEKSLPTSWNWRRKFGQASEARSGMEVTPKYSTRLQVESRTASCKPNISFIISRASDRCTSRNATFSRNSTGTFSKFNPPQTMRINMLLFRLLDSLRFWGDFHFSPVAVGHEAGVSA